MPSAPSHPSRPNEQSRPPHGELHKHRSDIARYLERLGIPSRMVEELTQDVLLVAYTRKEQFRGKSALRTWLFGIAFHLVLNWRRKHSRREHCDESCVGIADARASATWHAGSTNPALDAVVSKQLCSRVAKALDAESEVACRLWLMVTFDETAVAKASRLLGLKEAEAYVMFSATSRRLQSAARKGRRSR